MAFSAVGNVIHVEVEKQSFETRRLNRLTDAVDRADIPTSMEHDEAGQATKFTDRHRYNRQRLRRSGRRSQR